MSLYRERGTELTTFLAPKMKPILIHKESGPRPQTAKTVTLKTADGVVVSPLNLDLIKAKDEP